MQGRFAEAAGAIEEIIVAEMGHASATMTALYTREIPGERVVKQF
jgi:hypothetical protein